MTMVNTTVPKRVVQYYADQNGCPFEHSEQLFQEVTEFLDRCSESSEPITPTQRVDEAWHCFILHTSLYAKFCNERYGRFIHHNPFPKEPSNRASRRQSTSESALQFATAGNVREQAASCNDGGGDGNCSGNCGSGDCNSGGDA